MAVTPSGPTPIVIVLSWDGMRHDYPDRAAVPGLERMQSEGVRAERLTPPFPSSTFPGHVTLATGAPPDVHGIVDNRFFDRERGIYSYSSDSSWLQAEPIWIAAERQGVRAATYFWVGSETRWQGKKQTYQMTPFDASVPEAVKVDQILAWLDLPEKERPGLIMAYWRGVDSVAHDMGPDHPDVAIQMQQQDEQLVRLLEGIDARKLWPRTTLMIVSDHGMTEIEAAFDLQEVMTELDLSGQVFGSSVAHVFLDLPERAMELVIALQAYPEVSAWEGKNLPRRFRLAHPTRTGDVVVVADQPIVIASVPWWQRAMLEILSWFDDRVPGGHGYHPTQPDMGAIFLAMGRDVAAGRRIEAVDATDLAPTIAALLRIEPPAQSEGTNVPLQPTTVGAQAETAPLHSGVPGAADDDVVAQQLRAAATNEPNPELQKKLWDEYRKYKAGS